MLVLIKLLSHLPVLNYGEPIKRGVALGDPTLGCNDRASGKMPE
jgi:hypothetical protein